MAARQRVISCDAPTCSRLCEAVRGYAQAAFPPGGSDCAQASRQGLLEIADRIERDYPELGGIGLRSRQQRMLESAIKVYFAELAGLPDDLARQIQEGLLALLRGEALAEEKGPQPPQA